MSRSEASDHRVRHAEARRHVQGVTGLVVGAPHAARPGVGAPERDPPRPRLVREHVTGWPRARARASATATRPASPPSLTPVTATSRPPRLIASDGDGAAASATSRSISWPAAWSARTPAAYSGQHDQVRPGQPQPEALAAHQQIGGAAAAGEQVIDELQALRFLAAGDRQVGTFEALGRGRYRVVGGPQHAEPGRPQIGQAGQFAPQPPGRRQVQVDQAAQGHAALRGPLPRPAVLGQLGGDQAAAGTRPRRPRQEGSRRAGPGGTPPASRLAAWAIASRSTTPSAILPVVGKFMSVMLAGYAR